jgi:Ni,Fe-hydrogenase I small subunit
MKVTRDSLIEDLLEAYPGVVRFLVQQGLPCVVCGEPFWGSLAELASEKHWSDQQIDQLVADLTAELMTRQQPKDGGALSDGR